ncbi:MAG: hypothetical protein RL398_3465 [Planctomycetota bacterium]|jgi:hypothetical protein
MLRDFLSGITLTDLPVVAMVLFLAIFLAVLVRVCQRARFAEYDRMSNLPLQEDPSMSTDGRGGR